MTNLPNKAKRVFKGILFDIYQWEQEMFDGTTKTFEQIHRAASVEVITVVDDKILVAHQQQPGRMTPYPSLPGGKIEEGETPEQAARRELLEETGYEAGSLTLFSEYHGNSKFIFPEYVFIARDCRRVAEPNLDNGEKLTVAPYTFDDFLSLCRDDSFSIAYLLRIDMYEALLDPEKKEAMRKRIFDQ